MATTAATRKASARPLPAPRRAGSVAMRIGEYPVARGSVSPLTPRGSNGDRSDRRASLSPPVTDHGHRSFSLQYCECPIFQFVSERAQEERKYTEAMEPGSTRSVSARAESSRQAGISQPEGLPRRSE